MKRIVVIGNAGGGKSTMSTRLGTKLGIKVYYLDSIQWKPGWVLTSPEEFIIKHDELIAFDSWIIDGWGFWESIEARALAADMIIFVDYQLRIHYWWALKRHLKCIFQPRFDLNGYYPMLPITFSLAKSMWTFHTTVRPKLVQLFDKLRDHKHIVHLRSPRDMNLFIRQYC